MFKGVQSILKQQSLLQSNSLWRRFNHTSKDEFIWSRIRPKKSPSRAKKNSFFGLGLIVGGILMFEAIDFINDKIDSFYEREEKEKIVVLGSGWAALSFINVINTYKYDVTVISPNNYFLFTPLLSKVALGTVSAESIAEPVRRYSRGNGLHFFEAKAIDIDVDKKLVKCQATASDTLPFDVPYDKLIVAVGAKSNTLGIDGVERYAHKLRDVDDSIKIRNKLIDCLEKASLPSISEEEKRKLLSFVIVGGGPTASQFATSLYDYIMKNLHDTFPTLQDYIKLTIVKTNDHIHNYYDKSISTSMGNYLRRPSIIQDTGSIEKIGPDSITMLNDSKDTKYEIPFGMCVWSTGNSVHPFIRLLQSKFKDQNNVKALVTNMSLEVQGTKDIFAIGDCATINQGTLLKKWSDVFKRADLNGDGTIDLDEFKSLLHELSRTYPALKALNKHTFEEFDDNHDNVLSEDEFKKLLSKMETTLTRFPCTATVAAQQGDFLAYNLNKGKYDTENGEPPKEEDMPVFRYKHIGGYEYVGAEDGFVERGSKGIAIVSGPGALWMWKAAFFSRIVSTSLRVRMIYDWAHNLIFRDQGSRV